MAQVRIPSDRPPTPPGEMLLEEFIRPLGMTQAELADRIGVSYVRLNEIVNGRRGITPSTALRLAKALGTTPSSGSTASSHSTSTRHPTTRKSSGSWSASSPSRAERVPASPHPDIRAVLARRHLRSWHEHTEGARRRKRLSQAPRRLLVHGMPLRRY